MNTIIISFFSSIVLLRELSLAYRVKSMIKLDQFTPIKVLDCFPCFTFWVSIITLFFTQDNIIYSLAIFILATIYDKLWN
jgi:hypothetical protein